MPAFISAEAALSYLGVSVRPPTPTLGNILKDAIQYASGDFLYFFAPAFLIALIVVSFNLLGDGLRDALDPRAIDNHQSSATLRRRIVPPTRRDTHPRRSEWPRCESGWSP